MDSQNPNAPPQLSINKIAPGFLKRSPIVLSTSNIKRLRLTGVHKLPMEKIHSPPTSNANISDIDDDSILLTTQKPPSNLTQDATGSVLSKTNEKPHNSIILTTQKRPSNLTQEATGSVLSKTNEKPHNSEIIIGRKPPSPSIIIHNRSKLTQETTANVICEANKKPQRTFKIIPLNAIPGKAVKVLESLTQNVQQQVVSTNLDAEKENKNYSEVHRVNHKPLAQNPEQKVISTNLEAEKENKNKKYPEVHCISDIVNPDLKFVAKRLRALQLDIDFIKKQVSPRTDFTLQLPIDSRNELDEICSRIENDDEYAANLRKYLIRFAPVENHLASSGITKLLSDQVIFFYNWDGTKNKLALKSLVLFKTIVFDAWKASFNNNFNLYESSMRKQIHYAHSRQYQKKSRENKTNI